MTQFDPQAFLDLPVDTVFEKRPPLPVGDYIATIKDITPRPWTGKNDPTKSGMAYDVQLTLEVPAEVQAAIGITLPTLQLKDSIMLDLTVEGAFDGAPGRNRQLRNYREALDMNKPGETFRAREMIGKMLLVKVGHETYQGNLMERVNGVAKV